MGSGAGSTAVGEQDTVDERTDAELLLAFRAGDVAVFSILYERHRPAAMRYARSLAHSEFAANDAVSDGFLRVYSALTKGDGPVDAFRAYLYTAIRSAVVDEARRTSKVRYTDDLQPYEDSTEPLDMAAVEEDRDFVSKAFGALTDQWKQVLWLTSVEGRRHNEVAEILGLKPNAVAALALRAREGLRQNYLTAHLRTTDTRDECRRTVKNLAALVRAKISPREKEHADSHLLGCRRCRVAAVMLTDLNRVMPAIALPALLAPAPWLVHLHQVTAGIGSLGTAPATAAAAQTHAGAAQSRPADVVRGAHRASRHGGLQRRTHSERGRVSRFARSHTVAVVVGVLLALTAGGVSVAAGTGHLGTHHKAALAAPVVPIASVSVPAPTPTPPRSTTPAAHQPVKPIKPAAKKSRPAVVNPNPNPQPTATCTTNFVPTTSEQNSAAQVLHALNNSRAAHGLPALIWCTPLEHSAIAHDNTMIATHTIGHQVSGEPDFGTRLSQYASCTSAAENVGTTTTLSTSGAVGEEQVMADEQPPGTTIHRDNILSPRYTEVGIAVGVDTVKNLLLITEEFCRP